MAYGPDGLARLAAGEDPSAILAGLVAADSMGANRQAGIVDAQGSSATWTGAACIPWAGGRTVPGVAIQGNCLTGPEVVDAMLAAWEASTESFPRRLVAALRAGDQAGGDARGRQSAALLVRREKGGVGEADDRWIDLRIDDHTDPVTELGRLLTLHENQTKLDAEKLAQIGTVIVTQVTSAIKTALAPKDPAAPAAGTLTSSPADLSADPGATPTDAG